MGGRRRRRLGGRRRSSSFPSHVAEQEGTDESSGADTSVQDTNRPQDDAHGRFFFRTYGTRRPDPWIDPRDKIMVLHAIMFPRHSSRNENVVSSEISEVLSPGDFMKTIVRHGDGSYLPKNGVGVEVHLTATSSDGCQFASTRQGEPLSFVLGAGLGEEEEGADNDVCGGDEDDDIDKEEDNDDGEDDIGQEEEEEEEEEEEGGGGGGGGGGEEEEGMEEEEEEEDDDDDDKEEEEEEEDTINKGGIAALLHTAIGTMRIGERAVFTIAFSSPCDETGNSETAASVDTVQYDIELLSAFHDLHGDRGIIMKLISGGCDWSLSSWDVQPTESDCYVTVKYEARLTDGTLISKSDGIEFSVEDGHFCPAISTAVLFLRERQKAKLTVKPQYAFGDEGRPRKADDGEVPPNATIEVNLELLFMSFVFGVGHDETIQVRRLRRGPGNECAGEDSLVQVRLIGRLQDGTVFMNKGHNGTKTYEIKISQDQVVDGLDEAMSMMTEGDIYLVTVPPEHAFGSEGSQQQLAFVPANATVTFEVELVSIISKRKHYGDMETKECIETAWKKKEEGDVLVRSKQYKQASKRYDKAVEVISLQLPFDESFIYTIEEIEAYLYKKDEIEAGRAQQIPISQIDAWGEYALEELDKYVELRMLIVPSNLCNAECQMDLGNYQKAAHLCTEVLILDSKHTEAQRIRSQAYSLLSDNRLTELDIMITLEDFGLNRVPENDVGRRLWLFNRYMYYRLYGSKSFMGR
ncbi:70 kDa peptidyl-prolyl isomerase-like [Panicum miliaceum]|uniref:peptidylprolyl isomerase n=1 Tax=Panicum miliaceum TaxID=4540 RepID=A0A3L6RK89_PANMI|nr:70 kDa peptidyl-prolyl isomerase-like [Panicum miliaceum]